MAGSSPPAPRRHNKASWVALRTLRQVPKHVGETRTGDPIFEIRSVRLVLRGDANHFNRIVACSKCGRDVPGPPVLSPTDLDHHPNAVICKDCVRSATQSNSNAPQQRPAVAENPASNGAPRNGEVSPKAEAALRDDGRLAALEQRMAGMAELLNAQRDEWQTTVERGAQEMRAEMTNLASAVRDLAGAQERLEGAVSEGANERLTAGGNEDLPHAHDETSRRLDRMAERLEQDSHANSERLQVLEARVQELLAAFEGDRAQARSYSAALQQANEELARVEQQLTQRLERSAERAARTAESDDRRLEDVERQIHEAVGRLAETVESHRLELEAALRDGLAEAGSAIAAVAKRTAGRMEGLEEKARQSTAEMSELGELQATLDAGLGELRSQIAAVRGVTKELANGQAEVKSRLQGLGPAQRPATVEPGRGRRLGGRSVEAGAQMAAVSAATDDLLREQQQLKAQLAMLDQTTGAAADAAANASSQASALAPLRSDVRALAEQLAAQNEALASLSKSVERLRRKVPAQAPAAKGASKATRATKATKATKG